MASPPSPTQLALYGETATVIRQAMERKGMKVTALNAALGYKPSNPTAYYWLNAKSAPGPATRTRLAKILNVDPSSLIPKDEPQMPSPPTTLSETASQPVNGTPVLTSQAISLSISSDGTAELKFNLTLPAKEALRLLVTLTDEGLIAYPSQESPPNDKTNQSV